MKNKGDRGCEFLQSRHVMSSTTFFSNIHTHYQTPVKVASENGVPFFGNGDVLHWEDYFKHLENDHVSGAMIGRGALIKPWLFQEIKERRTMDPSSSERFEMLKVFVQKICFIIRKHICCFMCIFERKSVFVRTV